MHTVTVRHNFETAHRLYDLGPGQKCWNVHGHSWWVEIDVSAYSLDSRGMVVEFGEFKKAIRTFIDEDFDHGIMLNNNDPLVEVMRTQGCKVATFHADPTVEAVATTIEILAGGTLLGVAHAPNAWISAVRVQETHVNGASVTA